MALYKIIDRHTGRHVRYFTSLYIATFQCKRMNRDEPTLRYIVTPV